MIPETQHGPNVITGCKRGRMTIFMLSRLRRVVDHLLKDVEASSEQVRLE